MNLIIKNNYDEISNEVSNLVIDLVNKKPDSLICIAGGETPFGLFKSLVEASKNGKVDLSKCKFVGLDEWVGLGRETKGSCQETLYNNFFDLIPLSDDQICFFNGLAEDLDKECKRVDSFISDNNSIDIMSFCLKDLNVFDYTKLNVLNNILFKEKNELLLHAILVDIANEMQYFSHHYRDMLETIH